MIMKNEKGIEVKDVMLSDIFPCPENPRKTFDQKAIEELAQNIESQGLLQPITVRRKNGNYEVVCGERRYRAYGLLAGKDPDKYAYMPCIVREMTDAEAFDAMITENLQRQDVDPMEESQAFSLLVKKGSTVQDIAARFGKTERFVQDRIKLGGLIPELRKKVKEGWLPIGGAMMLAKLDKDRQKRFLNNYGHYEGANAGIIKRFLDDLFRSLDSADFYRHDGWDKDMPLCRKCEYNTGNYGCLFWEMKGKHKCTNEKCFSNKRMKYVLHRIFKEKARLVRKGEPYAFGKSVVVVEESEWWPEEKKEAVKQIRKEIEDAGIEIADPVKVFRSKCYYDEKDERIAKMLAENEIYRCVGFTNYGNIMYNVSYWYVKQGVKSDSYAVGDSKDLEIDKINSDIERNKKRYIERYAMKMREWAQEKTGYSEKTSDMSVNEKLVMDIMVLRGCSDGFLNKIGLSKYAFEEKKSWIDYVRNNQSDRPRWYREFIRNNLTSNDVNFYSYLQECQRLIFSEQYPDEYDRFTQDELKKFEKKDKKLRERLKELKGEA